MSRVDFYHLQRRTADEVLPLLLGKAYAIGKRCIVRVGKESKVEEFNSELWTFADDSFLPHGSKKDGFASDQPIWITPGSDNPNNAEFLFLTEGAEATPEEVSAYERVFNIFDGNSETALQQARSLWKTYKAAGCGVFYWQQTPAGKWEQKA